MPALTVKSLTFSSLYVSAMLQILDGMGFSIASSLDVLGLDEAEIANPRTRVSMDGVNAVFNKAAAALSRPAIGLEAGFQFRVATFSETGSILAYSRTLREAAEMNGRYEALAETIGDSTFVEVGDRAFLRWTPRFQNPEAYRHLTDLIFGGYATTVRWLGWTFGGDLPSVNLMHARPPEPIMPIYREVFRCEPDFDCAHNQLEFIAGTADLELPTYSPDKLSEVRLRLDSILLGDAAVGSKRLTKALRACLSNGITTRERFADHMGMSSYALDKELASHNMTFRQLRERARQDEFDSLSRKGMALSEIALNLGYNDQAAFTKAFRRWHGMTPSSYLTKF